MPANDTTDYQIPHIHMIGADELLPVAAAPAYHSPVHNPYRLLAGIAGNEFLAVDRHLSVDDVEIDVRHAS